MPEENTVQKQFNLASQPCHDKIATEPSAIFHEPEESYHAQSGCNTQGKNLSSHLLSAFRSMPYKYQQMVSGNWHWSRSKAYLEGSVFHAYVLEGKLVCDERYVSEGPVNPNTGLPFGITTKKWTEWEASMGAQGFTVITPPTRNLVTKMADSVSRHKEASRILNLSPIREGVIRCKYNGFDCQTRMDAFGTTIGIVDLKSCADIYWFQGDAHKYGYLNQLAFYRQILRKAVPDACDDVHIIATEKSNMLTTGVWKLSHAALDEAQEENEMEMQNLSRCMQTGVWPTGYENIRSLTA